MTGATSGAAVNPSDATYRAHLEITARPAPELLERLARVLRHRGATIERLSFDVPADTGTVLLSADLRCPTPVEGLVRQLRRLPDVHSVEAA